MNEQPLSPNASPTDPTRSRALLALLLIVPAPTIGVWAAMMAFPGPVGTTIFGICKAWMLALPVVWLLVIDRGRLSWSRPTKGGFGVAAFLGLAISAVIFAAYFLLGERWIDVAHVREMAEQNGIGTPARYLLAVAYWVLINSVLEEYVYRWFIFRKCEALMPPLVAVLAAGAAFTIHHVLALRIQFDWNVTLLASLGVFIGGTVWSWLYLKYRSIWPGYLSHAIVDIAVFTIGWLIIFGGR